MEENNLISDKHILIYSKQLSNIHTQEYLNEIEYVIKNFCGKVILNLNELDLQNVTKDTDIFVCGNIGFYSNEIVSGRDLIFGPDSNPDSNSIDLREEELVWRALEICKCEDFMKRTNFDDKRKWIYSPNIGMSGGQKGRVGLARTIYRIMCSQPQYITLDEVDKCIQSEMVVEIMSNVFEYAKQNNILAFIIAHNPDVKKMDSFDQVIKFSNGIICK